METTISESLNKAFQLAYFIHANSTLAKQIVIGAAAKLEVATAAQDKRLYYTPAGRNLPEQSKPQKLRTKVSMSSLHLLQRLVYIESESHEREQEQIQNGAFVDEEDMVIRFTKHLVRVTIKRNSFYVTLGVNRLLFNYSTPETMEIYGQVIQNADRVRDDYYYRSRKRRLLQEIQERFGNFVRLSRGTHREERFQVRDNPAEQWRLVEKCLRVFTPWNTSCVVPENWDHTTDTLAQLSFEGDNPDNEHPIEMNRMHSILHPDCLSRITNALNLESPAERLAIPHFFLSEGEEDRPRGDRNDLPELSQEELMTIQGVLAEGASRRKAFSGSLLAVIVDGTERARIDLRKSARVQFEVDEDAELIEVRARDGRGDILLAAHLLTDKEGAGEDQALESSVVLEDGQKVEFIICHRKDSNGELAGSIVDVVYRETRLLRSVPLLLRRLKSRVLTTERGKYSPLASPVIASILALIIISGLVFYVQSRRGVQVKDLASHQTTAPADDSAAASNPPEEHSSPALKEDVSARPTGPAQADKPARFQTPQIATSNVTRRRDKAPNFDSPIAKDATPDRPASPQENADAGVEATRSMANGPGGISLLDVKKVYVDSLGDEAFSQQVRDALISSLRQSKQFTVTEKRERADAVFKGNVARRLRKNQAMGEEIGRLTLRMIEANGGVLWSTTQSPGRLKYKGSIAQVAGQVVKEMIASREKLERAANKGKVEK